MPSIIFFFIQFFLIIFAIFTHRVYPSQYEEREQDENFKWSETPSRPQNNLINRRDSSEEINSKESNNYQINKSEINKRNGPIYSSVEFLFPLQEENERNKGIIKIWNNTTRQTNKNNFQVSTVPLMRLTKDILAPGRYDVRVRPVNNHSKPLKIYISMSLYQIIDVNEPAQNIKMNVWMIQKWKDEMLHWDPREYDMINSTILPHEVLWIPDTYLYNSVVMNAEETERYMNIRADSLFWERERGSNMSFLYPAIYTVTCRLNIRYFPYDQQNCTLTISSWTNSKSALDYYADPEVNLASFISNEEWDVMSFRIFRHEYKYACCPEPWVILEASIVIRRKPLYYVINLILPTSIITLVAITGFFTPASTADDRTEKINLGITTLLAMSILMLMVSDQMPTTSEFVPLIAWFYLSIIIIISIGTFLTSVILSIQGRRQYGQLPSLWIRHLFFVRISKLLWLAVPPPLLTLWEEMNDHPLTARRRASSERFEKSENRRLSKSLRNSLKQSIKESNRSKAPSLAFEGSFVVPPSPNNLNGIDHQHKKVSPINSTNTIGRAKKNWLRVSSIISRKSDQSDRTVPSIRSQQQTDFNLNIISSRRSSEAVTNWENAIDGLGVVSPRQRELPGDASRPPTAGGNKPKKWKKRASVAAEVNAMKVKRQCSLEWEFLATILDRLFLLVFAFTTVIVTLGMMVTGKVAQWQYEQAAREIG
ncbi:hypothetical protein ACQ4LE_003059 [Meloidogyne hapla]|uniref:Neur_chan_LBD domain-containing protein n=1 Tax=Meloidogyne hapla TaxID=6305 RepID=A0A1I8BH95_MELHA